MKTGLMNDMPVIVNDWLSSTAIALMTPAEEGGYWHLLLHAWSDTDCCLPDDDETLAQLSRLGPAWRQSAAKIRKCFTVDPARPGHIYNEAQRKARISQQNRISKAREQRTNAANSRWAKNRMQNWSIYGTDATALQPQNGSICGNHASYSLLNTHTYKDKKLTIAQADLAARMEACLADQWVNDAGKWVDRIKKQFAKVERVTAELESAAKEGRIKSTPAQYVEQIWKEFA